MGWSWPHMVQAVSSMHCVATCISCPISVPSPSGGRGAWVSSPIVEEEGNALEHVHFFLHGCLKHPGYCTECLVYCKWMCTALNVIVAIIHSMACTLAVNEFRYVGEDTLANFPTWGFSLLILDMGISGWIALYWGNKGHHRPPYTYQSVCNNVRAYAQG